MTKNEFELFFKKTSHHLELLKKSNDVACYYCLKVYKFSDIKEFCDRGQTAICPHCNIDAVVPFDWQNHETELKELKEANKIGFSRSNKK